MTRTWIVVASLSFVACGKKPDCEHYATHLAELNTARLTGDDQHESRRKSVEFVAREACTSGEMSASVVACVNAATTSDEALRCELGDKATPPAKPAKPAGVAVHRTGFSVQMPASWSDDSNKTEKTEALLRGDGVDGVMILRVPGTPKGLASDDACRSAAARFSANTGAIMESAGLSGSEHLGTDCRMFHHDVKMRIEGHAYAAGDHESLIVNCFYAKSLATSPPFCHDVIASIALD